MKEIQRSIGGTALFASLIMIELQSVINVIQNIYEIHKWAPLELGEGVAKICSIIALIVMLAIPIRWRIPRFVMAAIFLATLLLDFDYFWRKLLHKKAYKGALAASMLMRSLALAALCMPIRSKLSEATPFVEREACE